MFEENVNRCVQSRLTPKNEGNFNKATIVNKDRFLKRTVAMQTFTTVSAQQPATREETPFNGDDTASLGNN